MKKNKNVKIYYILLIVLFICIAVFIRFRAEYNDYLTNYLYEKFPAQSEEGFTVRKSEINLSYPNEADKFISLKPGDVYDGALLVKNYNTLGTKEFIFSKLEDFSKSKNLGIDIVFDDGDILNLNAREWRKVKYKIFVSDDVEYKDYLGVISFRENVLVKNNDGFALAYGVGVNFNINVSDNPVEYVYEDTVQDFSSLSWIAIKHTIVSFYKYFGICFGLLSLYFLFMFFKDDYKGRKKKK